MAYKFKYSMNLLNDEEANINLYGEISRFDWWDEDVSAKKFSQEMKKIEDAKKLNVYINTPGGDVFEAVAIRSEIIKHKAVEKNIYVTGLCASAGTLPMCIPSAKVHFYQGAMMMIHQPSSFVYGTAKEMEKAIETLKTVSENAVDIYNKKTGISQEELMEYMDAESYFNAEKAVELGFADEIVQEQAVDFKMSMSSIQMCGYKNVPQEIISNVVATTEINNNLEDEEMTLEELKQKEPELCSQLMQMGISEENARLRQLDSVYAPEDAKMVEEAKYGEKRMSYGELCISLNQKARERQEAGEAQTVAQGINHIANRAAETQGMSDVEPSAEEDKGVKDAEKKQIILKRIAEKANKRSGGME